MKIIAGGGFGNIYQIDDNTVIKAIHTETSCAEAKREFLKQQKIYDSFQKLKHINFSGGKTAKSRLLKLVQKYIVVSRPISFIRMPVTLDNINYSCAFTMTKLNGIPLSILSRLDDKLLSEFDNEYFNAVGKDFQLLGHLSFNTTITGVVGIDVDQKISEHNPARGYFIAEDSKILKNLRRNHDLKLSDDDIKQIIGFVYGFIFSDAHIVPLDIEIALGITKRNFVINVLDFGMTFDMIDMDNNTKSSTTEPYFEINESNVSSHDKYENYLNKMFDNISIDLYGDITDDAYVKAGFDEAVRLSKQLSFSLINIHKESITNTDPSKLIFSECNTNVSILNIEPNDIKTISVSIPNSLHMIFVSHGLAIIHLLGVNIALGIGESLIVKNDYKIENVNSDELKMYVIANNNC